MFQVKSWKPSLFDVCSFQSLQSCPLVWKNDNMSLVFRLNHIFLNKPLLSTLKQWQKLRLKITDTRKSVSLKEKLAMNAMKKKIVIEKTH